MASRCSSERLKTKVRHHIFKSIVAKNEENTKQLLEERAVRARDYNDYHIQRVRDFK